jgi:CBS domain-containing protein
MSVEKILREKGFDVVTAKPSTKIADIVGTLAEKKIGVIVISDDESHVAGILSERDIVRGLKRHGPSLLDKVAKDLMTSKVRTCTPSDTVSHLMALMSEHRIRHVPVVVEGKLCGLLSIGDIVKSRLGEIESEASALRAYVTG